MDELYAHAALAVCCALLGMAQPPESKTHEFGVRGRISKIAPPPASGPKKDTILGYVTVLGKKEADTETDQAVVIVTRGTKIMRRNNPMPLAFADLKTGMRIQAKFDAGPRIMIYPPRVAATEILIIGGPAGPGGKS